MPTINIHLTQDPIAAPSTSGLPGAGACADFQGIVRPHEDGAPIEALVYEAYESMAQKQMTRIATDLATLHACMRVTAIHRLGTIPAGEAAILVRAESKHRAAAFDFLRDFMDRLKQEVPIWKVRSLPAPPPA